MTVLHWVNMGGLSKIRGHAANQFRQAKLKELLQGKRAVLIDMGSLNAITTNLVATSRMSMAQALSYALRWLKGAVLPFTSGDAPLEVTVTIKRTLLFMNRDVVLVDKMISWLQLMFEGGMGKRKDTYRQQCNRHDELVSLALEQPDRAQEYLRARALQKLTFQHALKATIEADHQ